VVYLDTNAIIYSVEKIAPYDGLLLPMWAAARAGTFTVVSSELALLETLVKPFQIGDTVLEGLYRALLTGARDTRLMPIDGAILEEAARLRAHLRLKTPDAIHAASAARAGASLFVSNDPAFRRVPGLPLVILDDLLSP
jgi:predicted nucleic acid-binding protein